MLLILKVAIFMAQPALILAEACWAAHSQYHRAQRDLRHGGLRESLSERGLQPLNLACAHIDDRAPFGAKHLDVLSELMGVCGAGRGLRQYITFPVKDDCGPAILILHDLSRAAHCLRQLGRRWGLREQWISCSWPIPGAGRAQRCCSQFLGVQIMLLLVFWYQELPDEDQGSCMDRFAGSMSRATPIRRATRR